MASREFQVAMVAYAARIMLEASRPLTMDEIFPEDGSIFGQKLSRSLQKLILNNMFKDGLISEWRKNGIVRWEVRDEPKLQSIAAGCPPSVPEDEENMPYHGKEAEKRARIAVAIRALKRLMAADASSDTARVQPKATLFIAKKGDKHQQKQVWDKSWQGPFLDRIVDQGSLEKLDDSGLTVYRIYNKKYVQAVIDNTARPCIETLLWPDTPCTIDHTKPPQEVVKALGDASQVELEPAQSEPEIEESEDEPEPAQVVTQAVVEAVGTVAEAIIEPKPEPEKIDGEERLKILEAIETLMGCYESMSGNVLAQSEGMKKLSSLVIKTSQEIEHLHSKMDKLHEENTTLRKVGERHQVSLDSIVDIVQELSKSLDPNESSISSIRKRLSEIEKLATEHKSSLEASNKLLRTGLGEAASSMVAQAAKVFVQQDHSEVLVKMASVEENVLDAQTRTTKVLGEVYEALEKVRGEYKNNNRVPVILQRMEAISEELKTLQNVLANESDPNVAQPVRLKIVSPDLTDV